MVNIFLSHAAFDSDMALYLKTAMEGDLEGLEIFCSSDPSDLPPGTKWPAELQNELNRADMLLLLATSRSLSRPWVWFECGTFWFKDKRIIPVCIGRVRKNGLPTPFAELMAVNLDDPSDVNSLFQSIEDLTSTKRRRSDILSIVNTLQEKERAAEEKVLLDAGWLGARWENGFLSYEGPIESLRLIEDRPFEQSMSDALISAGFSTRLGGHDRFSHHAERGYRIVYLTDRKSWRQKITHNELVLLAKP